METNIYIQAMEIGYSHHEGITYKRLKKILQLKTLGPIEGRREYTFIKWFIKNFDAPLMPIQGSEMMKRYYSVLIENQGDKENLQAYRDFSNKTYFLKGKAVKQYLNYLVLKETRQQAKNAQRASIVAIGIAILTLVLSIYFSAPPPPDFYVNGLEKPKSEKEIFSKHGDRIFYPDREKDGAMIQEIYELKDELNKADELIEYYESEDYIKQIRATGLSSHL